MVAALRAIAVVLVVCAALGDVRADKLAVANVSAEPDLADEAGAVTFLARSALLGDDRAVIDAPGGITVGSAPGMLDKIGAEHAVLMDLGRDGMKLRLTVAIVSAKAAPVVKVVRAGDGDVIALAREAADLVTGTLNIAKGRVPQIPLGRLHPFAVALRLRASDPAGAAGALADGSPSVALAVPAIGTLLAGLPAAAADPTIGVLAARVLGDRAFLDKAGAEASELAAAARALSAISRTDTATARAELGAKPKSGVALLAAAILAELAGDRAQLGTAIKRGLASDQMRAMLAFASSVETLDPSTLDALVAAAEKIAGGAVTFGPNAPGVTSRIGLFAALANVALPRALALVSARHLDTLDLVRLERLVATGSDATSLRLRAELALCRSEDRATVAIGTFTSEATADPRSARYQGWLLASKSMFSEAAKVFAQAGARREMLRALAAARDWAAALRAIDGKPSTAEELAVLGQTLLESEKLGEAAEALIRAEQAAPMNPLVQGVLAQLFARQGDKDRTQLAWMLSTLSGAPPEPVAVAAAAGGSAKTGTSDRVVIDLEDPRVFEPMLEALQLRQLARSKVVIAELAWEPGVLAFRETHPEVVRGALAKVLANAPYDMQITHAHAPFTGEKLPLDQMVKLTADADAVVTFQVQPSGSKAEITLMLFEQGGTQAIQVTRVVALPGAVGFNSGKLILVLAVVLVLVIAVVLRVTRSMGKIEIQIPRNVEKDEALCIEVTKNPKRPPIVDLIDFHNATKKAGTITKRFLATLVGTQTVMKVPSGVWYVHLYGTYSKSGKLRAVPESCSQKVELRRGDFTEIVFDLVPKLADITVEVIYESRKDVVVWANDEHARRKPDADGKVELQLPVGNHRINVRTPRDTVTQMLNVPTTKSIRLGINVTRELRLMKDLELGVDAQAAGELELELTSGPRTPLPGTLDKHAAEAVARTHALSPAQAAAASSASARARASIPGPGETLLARYRITEELGRGAMGVVHRGWDEKLEREVAIKLMADDLRAIPEAMNLFTSEAKALAQLNHTNIVAMYDQVTDADKVYMIMEFVDGQTLESMIAARGPLPWYEAASIIDQVCAGLAYAHARKVIHRDIKPANIFVASDQTVKLGDFGLARVMREVTIRRTEVRGTPLYMAPEQITGTDIDHRTDLYAVGCTLFELVTGRPPFIDGDIMYAQMNTQPPAPSTFAPDLPDGVDALILALLSKRPDERPGSANEVRAALRGLPTS